MDTLLTFSKRIDARLSETKGRRPRIHIHCIVVHDREMLVDALEGMSAKVTRDHDESSLIVKQRFGNILSEFVFVPVEGPGWIVVSQGPASHTRHILRQVTSAKPKAISLLHLRSGQMRALYASFCQTLGLENAQVMSYYARRDSGAPDEKTRPKVTIALWQYHAEEKFGEYEKMGAYLVSFRFKGRGPNGSYSCQVDRHASATLSSGEFVPFAMHLAKPLLETGRGNLEFFNNRSRRVEPGGVRLRPIELGLDTELTKSHIQVLVRALARVSVAAIMYSGNPYFLASCYDKSDQSVYRVAALEKRLVIIPMDSTTEDALQRLFVVLAESLTETEPVEFQWGEESTWVPLSEVPT